MQVCWLSNVWKVWLLFPCVAPESRDLYLRDGASQIVQLESNAHFVLLISQAADLESVIGTDFRSLLIMNFTWLIQYALVIIEAANIKLMEFPHPVDLIKAEQFLFDLNNF